MASLAATAIRRGLLLVDRNAQDFQGLPLATVNPREEG